MEKTPPHTALIGKEYENLGKEIKFLGREDAEQALETLNKMKKILLDQASGSSKGDSLYDQAARDLTYIAFNQFGLNNFDDLLTEISEVQKNPITPMSSDWEQDEKDRLTNEKSMLVFKAREAREKEEQKS